ncbi:MAG TPA: UvrD-helicase domain-containing protein [Bdellovibrionota bacterium]|nr:UvrD-helicase domain-containing protein [Bdellovibrionota bacterium]
MTAPHAPFLPADQATRDRAITDHATVFSVEAGAGTGKTSLLAARYVALVEQQRASSTQIVAITFTEKAAWELKERIRSFLAEKKLASALHELDRAPISTIHAFAASLLRERPIDAGIDPNFEQLDGIAADLFRRKCYDRWLPQALEKNPGPFSRAIAAGLSFSHIQETAFALYDHRDVIAQIPPFPPSPDMENLFRELAAESERLWGLATRECVDTEDEGYRQIERFYREVRAARAASVEGKERALLLRIDPKPKGNQKRWARADACREQRAAMTALAGRLEKTKETLRESIAGELIGWLSDFVLFVEAEKRRSGKLDFDDLLFLARDLLKRIPDVRSYFQRRYRYFLVDEFQDTDPVQAEILWLLASDAPGAAHWSAWPIKPGVLFLVGDGKQSIYRFRRADIDTYTSATTSVAGQGERLTIHQSFRSGKSVIEWVNLTFGPILKEMYSPLIADPRHVSAAHRKAVVLLEPPELPAEGSTTETRRLEAEAVAAFLRKILDSGEPLVFDKTKNGLRPVEAGDIALLFPTTTDIDLFEETLRRYDLPFSLEGGHLFYARAEIHAALMTLEAIEHPTDPVAVAASLRSVLFGLSDTELFDLASLHPTLDYRNADLVRLKDPAKSAFEVLRQLHVRRNLLRPSQLLMELYRLTSAIPLSLTRRHGEQAAANLNTLAMLARSLERDPALTLDRFFRWAVERTEERDQQAESALSDEGSDRLRLLTVHKAKGLEFPVVVLANLAARKDHGDNVVADRLHPMLAIRSGSKKMGRFQTANFKEAEKREKTRREEENRRLLYVAATRTRDLLVIPKFLTERTSPLWTLLEEGWAAGESLVERVPFSSLPVRIEEGNQPPEDQKGSRTFSSRLVQRRAEVLRGIEMRKQGWVPGLLLQTATRLVEPFGQPALKKSAGPAFGRRFGSALHRILEKADFNDRSLLPALCARMAREESIPNASGELETVARTALDSPILGRIRRAEKIYRECPFSLNKAGVLYEGVIDLVFEEKSALVLVDYKTDAISKDQIPERARHYEPQLRIYREALETISGKKVAESLLFFVRLGRTAAVVI